MINKQNMWFVTLFSIILVLSIYYVTISDDTLTDIVNNSKSQAVSEEVSVSESDVLVSLRVSADEEVLAEMEKLQTILLDETATVEEKNDAYNSLQTLNSNKGKESQIEDLIEKEFKYKSFVKIKNDHINITISAEQHSAEVANNIIKKIQELYETRMYITVKFQK